MMPGEIISTCIISKDMDTETELKARVGRKEVKRVGQTVSKNMHYWNIIRFSQEHSLEQQMFSY